jgi:hypothetical protein
MVEGAENLEVAKVAGMIAVSKPRRLQRPDARRRCSLVADRVRPQRDRGGNKRHGCVEALICS